MGRIRTGLATCLVWVFLLVVTAQAGDYVVNSTDDDAATDGALRKEVLDLNADADATNTITFSVPDGSNIDISTNGNLDAIEQSITSFTSNGGEITLTNSGSSTVYGLRFSGSGDLVGGISEDFTIDVDTTVDSAYGIYGADALTIGDIGATITVDAVNSGASGLRSSWDTLTLGAVSGDISVYSDVNHVYGIYGGDEGIVMNGDFTGSVSAESGGNYATAINAEGEDLVVNGNIGGTISAEASGQQAHGIYAYADDILISGDLSADVTVTAGTSGARAVYAEGDDGDSDIWIGGNMSGNITAIAGTDHAYGFFVEDNDLTIDGSVTGDITVTAGDDSAYGMYAGEDIDIEGDYTGQMTVEAGDAKAYGLYARGNINMGGQLGGDISATATSYAYGISMLGADTTLSIDGGISGDITSNASSHKAYGLYLADGDITVNGGIQGDITAIAGSSYDAHGIKSTLGNITINGGIQGNITATAGTYNAYGITGDNTTITGGISGNTTVQAGTYNAYGIRGTTLNITGDITGDISATAGERAAYGLYGFSGLTLDGNITGDIFTDTGDDMAVGIYADTGDISITGNVTGNIRATAGTDDAYGLYANNSDITIDGNVTGNISVNADNDNAYGLSAFENISISGGISGNISTTADNDYAYGLYTPEDNTAISIGNGITGDISATAASYAYGISMPGSGTTLSIDGGILGDITSNASSHKAYGLYLADGDITVNGGIQGDITAVTGTSYQAYGIKTSIGDITINGGIQGNITATAGTYNAYGITGDNTIITGGISGNTTVEAGTYNAYGIRGTTLNVTGDITGDISATAGERAAYGLYGFDGLTVDGDVTGDISVEAGDDMAVGMYAGTGDISITGDVAGNITAIAQTDHTAMGIYAKGGTLNGGNAATAVDVSGDITATANGLAVGIAANDAMNLNISSTITATDSSGGTANYAIRSGADDGAGGWVDAAVNDTIQLSTGAVINTQADLAGGTDSLTLTGTGILSAEFLNTENLYKTGSGTWSLTADQTVDLTEVSGGTLAVNSTLTSTDVTVNSSGALGGSGTITGDVVNNGSVAPGNSPGTLTIAGNYTQNSGSTLDIEIAESAQDQLVVTGTTTINGGTLNLIVDEGVLVQDGASYIFIDAQGGYSGSFDDYETNSIFLTLDADDGAATLGGVVSRASYSIAAQDSNSEQVAEALDTALPVASGDLADALSALDLVSASDGATALTQLHPESYSALTENSFSTMRLFSGIALERFYAVNSDATQLTFQNPSRMLRLVSSGSLTSEGLSSLNMSTQNTPGVSKNQLGIYFAPVMQWEEYDTTTNRTGFEADTLGFTFGADYKPADNWLVGLIGGYATTDTQFEAPSSSTADSNHAMLGIYAGYKPGNFYFNGMVQGGISDNEMTRYIDLSSQTYEAEGDFYSYNLATNLTTGYDFTFQNYTFGPVASLDYGYVYNESFSESGASGLNLDVESNSANSFKTGLGARMMAMYDFNTTTRVIPFITAIWSHEFLNDSRTITSSFISSPGSAFSISTGDPDRDSMLLSVGATLSGAFKVDFFIRYNGDLLAGSRQAHAGVFGVQYTF